MKRTLLTAALFMVAAVGSIVSAQAIKGYQLTVTQGTYTALTDGTVITSGNTDVAADQKAAEVCFFKEGVATETGDFTGLPIGFNFKFGDKTVTTFGVSGSGFIILRGDEAFNFAPNARHYVFTQDDDNRNDVAGIALSMNAFGDNTKISYKTEGTAGSRTLTIDIANILVSCYYNLSDNPGICSIQYVLSEADNSIKVVLSGFNTFADGDRNSNVRFALRGNYNEGPAVEPFEDEDGNLDWTRATTRIVYSGVPTSKIGDGITIPDGLTFTFNYPAAVVAPTAQPTNMVLTSTPSEITYAFDTAEGADTYLVLYTKGMDEPAAPQNGVTYAEGDKLGACTVAYFGAYPEKDYERTISGLDPSSKYTIYVMAANAFGANGPAYLSANPLSASVMTAPEAPASVTLTGSTKTTVSGTCVANSINDEVIVVYTTKIVHNFPYSSTGDYGTPKGTYKVGDTVEEGHDGKVAYVGPAGAFTCDNLPASSPVFVAVFSHDANGEYSVEAAEGMTATTCEIPFEPDLMAWSPYMDPAAGWDSQKLDPNWTTKDNEETGTRDNIVDGFIAKTVKGTTAAPMVAYTCTPLIDVTKDAEVTFDWNIQFAAARFGKTAYAFTATDTLRIEVSEDAATWTTIAQVNAGNAPTLDPAEDLETYTPMKARLNDYIGKQVYVRIYFINTQAGFYGATITVKNFAVKEYVAPEVPAVSVTDVKAESAVISWDGTFAKYEVEYKGGTQEGSVTTEEKSYTLTGLTALTTYQVRVRGINADETAGEWSDPVTFTTTDYPAVAAPTNLSAVVSGTSVALSWDNNDDYVSFTVRYRPTSVTKWTEISNITENSCTVSGLSENTAYYWSVKAACTHDRTTSWAAQSEFTTSTTTGITDATSSEIRMAVSGNSLTVLNPGVEIGSIGVFDAQGRTVGNYEVNAATNVTIPMGATHTIYIVKVETAAGTRTYRIAR